ncbi:MAG: TonB-dependent receptor plug domain-containing protein [Steroidobacteraceae bacterium]
MPKIQWRLYAENRSSTGSITPKIPRRSLAPLCRTPTGAFMPKIDRSLDRTAIERTGAQTTAEVLRTLPQNFGGGQTQFNNFGAGNPVDTEGNEGQITAANLRGLGSNATLVLLDGHRLAPSGTNGAIDISSIPLDALDRIEIVTDGASAVYGSDAVAGVVNLITRHDYDGAQTTVDYGGTTEDGGNELRAAQTVGKSWGTGNALLSYEYMDQTAIWSSSRSYSDTVVPNSTLTPSGSKNSILASFNQDVGAKIHLFGDGFYTNRTSSVKYGYDQQPTDYETTHGRESQFSATIGANVDLPDEWLSTTFVTMAQDHVTSDTNVFSAGGQFPSNVDWSNTLLEAEETLSGKILRLPGGDLRTAVGGGYRREHPSIDIPTKDRHVGYGYFEIEVPIFGKDNARSLIHALSVNLEGRYESYSDFGTAFSPKAGITYVPVDGLKLRGTWGKSFHAPDEYQLYSGETDYFMTIPSGVAPGAPFNAFYRLGGNPDLRPETSTTYTTGIDLEPDNVPGLTLSATYYNIDYKNRILVPESNIFAILTDPAYAGYLTASPNPGQLQSYVSSAANYFDLTGGAPLNTAAELVDLRYQNAAALTTNGIDLITSYDRETSIGALDLQFNANEVFSYNIKNTSAAPTVSDLLTST